MLHRVGVAGLLTVVMSGSGTSGAAGNTRAIGGDSLEVRLGEQWHTLWRSQAPPSRWSAPDSVLARAIPWSRDRAGFELGSVDLRTAEHGRMVRVHLVRLDPRRLRLALHAKVREEELAPWSVADAPGDARLAFNAGQFTDAGPWGWVVHRGREIQPPAAGRLSAALVVDASGGVTLVAPNDLPAAAATAVEAIQSYPVLLVGDGDVPPEVRGTRPGLDLEHRDTRAAIGVAGDGSVILALTRMVVFGRELGPTPFGLTTGETAALMGALGARRAMMLDGGLSSQLLVRPSGTAPLVRRGYRNVPFGIVAR
jgi:hypothetical protein